MANFEVVFLTAIAFLSRLVIVLQTRAETLFNTPIVDAAAYVDQARALASRAGLNEALFWQPIFYPLFLSLMFRAGASLFVVRVFQALLGSISCGLVYSLARCVGGRRAGWLAGLLLTFYGPVIALETDLLAEGWAVFWAALLLWFFTRAASGCGPVMCAGIGVCSGLAILTRPTFIPFLATTAGWLIWRERIRSPKDARDRVWLFAAGLGLVLLPAAAACREYTGRFTVLPSSLGLNLFIGNNPRWVETVSIRPGAEWSDLIREPRHLGLSNIWEQSDYFRRKVAEYARTRPAEFVGGLLRKTARFFCSREIPRNHNLYDIRKVSPWLGVWLWKIGGFGFPFGLLFPLALLGVATQRRQLGTPALLFLALYPPAVIAVFPSDRYRLPMIPVLAAFAALGAVWLWTAFTGQRRSRGFAALTVMALVAGASSWPVRYPEEQLNYNAERHWAVGKRLATEGRIPEAETLLRRAAELDPSLLDAWNDLGILLETNGRTTEAIESYRRAVTLAPSNAGLRYNLGAALLGAGQIEEARCHLEQAVQLQPDYAPARELYDQIFHAGPTTGD